MSDPHEDQIQHDTLPPAVSGALHCPSIEALPITEADFRRFVLLQLDQIRTNLAVIQQLMTHRARSTNQS